MPAFYYPFLTVGRKKDCPKRKLLMILRETHSRSLLQIARESNLDASQSIDILSRPFPLSLSKERGEF